MAIIPHKRKFVNVENFPRKCNESFNYKKNELQSHLVEFSSTKKKIHEAGKLHKPFSFKELFDLYFYLFYS